MAKLPKGIFGPISGKLGPVIGGIWKGIPYLREAPIKKKKARPRSAAQLANEHKFKYVNDWFVPFHPYVTIGFQNLAIQKTAISAAFSVNYHEAVIGVYPNLGINYSKVIISKGNLPGLNDPEIVRVSADTIEIVWDTSSDVVSSYNDQIMLVLYCQESGMIDGFVGQSLRRDKHCFFKLKSQLAGKQLEAYVGVTSFDRKKISNSIYLGSI